MKSPTPVRPLVESEYESWTALVAASPDGSPYALPAYLDALCRAAGGSFRILGVWRGDELAGGLPLYETTTIRGVSVSPRLLLYYLGPVLRPTQSKYPSLQTSRTVEILDALAAEVERRAYAKVVLKGRHTLTDLRPFIARGWRAWPSYTYLVPLTDLRAQWNRVEQNLRRLIDRCESHGVGITEDDDFAGFFRLHSLTMSRHAAGLYLPEPRFREWFGLVRAAGIARLFHARLPSGQAIAAQLVLCGPHPVTHTVIAAADPEHRSLGASAFLRWRVFEALASCQYLANDLTDAALNPVTHFKSQLGGHLVTNIVLETAGTWRWRSVNALDASYRAVRAGAGRALRLVRGKGRTGEP